MELLRLELSGRPGQVQTPPGSPPHVAGLVGVDVSVKTIDGVEQVVVQALFDDDQPGFDRSLLDGVLVAELVDGPGAVRVRDLFDHDRFRRDLAAERETGIDDLRGVLVRTAGELPPHYLRLAFLPVPVTSTANDTLVIRRTTVDDLRAGVQQAHDSGDIGDEERRSMLKMLSQRHPS